MKPMFIIKSYIHNPNIPIYHFKEVEKNPLHYFIDINDTEKILRIKNDLDLNYIEGVLHLTYNNQVIIDFIAYDLIDHLWAYFLNMIETFLKNKTVKMYFPDTPIPMSMKEISNDYLLFSIDVETLSEWKLPKYEFFHALLFGAKDFFEKTILLIEEEKDNCLFELKRIKLLQEHIRTLTRSN